MHEHDSDSVFARLVRRAIVPKGLRPRSDDQIADMLDTIGGVPVDADKLARVLQKINGTERLGPAPSKVIPCPMPAATSTEAELVALHRAQGQSLPPDVEEKIRELERKATQSLNDDGAVDDKQ